MMGAQLHSQQQMQYDLNQLRDMTSGVQIGLAQSINHTQAQERDFMLSRQTLGRPMGETYGGAAGETLNNRAGQNVGATIVTQFNRDNLDEVCAVNDIDDLRRD